MLELEIRFIHFSCKEVKIELVEKWNTQVERSIDKKRNIISTWRSLNTKIFYLAMIFWAFNSLMVLAMGKKGSRPARFSYAS